MPSKAKLESNKEVVKGIVEDFKCAQGAVLVDYRGITVAQDTEFRAALRAAGVKYRIVKNTMTRFAVRELGLNDLEQYLTGPTALATSETDQAAPAKLLQEFAKKIDKLKIKAGLVEGKVIDTSGVDSLASLPTKEVLIAMVLGGFNAPISGFVNVLNGNLRGLVCALNAIVEKKNTNSEVV
ncbi:MAG: 50S ribosomal protein L10 [Oscillospiraceae bacterium]|nr:50S ribosomal protein L10 [Oscillospiraceae bacterium]